MVDALGHCKSNGYKREIEEKYVVERWGKSGIWLMLGRKR